MKHPAKIGVETEREIENCTEFELPMNKIANNCSKILKTADFY